MQFFGEFGDRIHFAIEEKNSIRERFLKIDFFFHALIFALFGKIWQYFPVQDWDFSAGDSSQKIVIPEKRSLRLAKAPQPPRRVFDFCFGKRLKKAVYPLGRVGRMAVFGATVLGVLLVLSGIGSAERLKEDTKKWGVLALSSINNGLSGAESGDFAGAFRDFQEAEKAFQEAESLLAPFVSRISLSYGVQGEIETADNLLRFGREVSAAAQVFLAAPALLNSEKNYLRLTEALEGELKKALTHLQNAQSALAEAKKGRATTRFKAEIAQAEGMLSELTALTERAVNGFDGVKTLLGARHPHTVLFLLQNSHEVRATGGFIGSLYFITFNNGEIVKKEFRDVYEFDANLREQVEPPAPLKLLADNWGLRDANYFPDFPESARQIQWFLEHEKGDSVDTIIALDEQGIEALLALTGELPLTADKNVNAENFNFILSFLVEGKIFGATTPKAVLADFIPVFTEKVVALPPQALFGALASAVREKHLFAYSFQPDVQALFAAMGAAGELTAPPKSDFLLVSHTSLSANKSDGFVDEEIAHKTLVNLAGEITDNLVIARTHEWGMKENRLFETLYAAYKGEILPEKDFLKSIMGQGANRVWTRVYVPRGSSLRSVRGVDSVEISEENGFTIFGFHYPLLRPGESAKVQLTYSLPFRVDFAADYDKFAFCWQKAAGITENLFTKDFVLESGLTLAATSEEMPFAAALRTDHCWRALLTKGSAVGE